MSSTEKSREEVKAAREAKKLAKQKAKGKGDVITDGAQAVEKKETAAPVKAQNTIEAKTKLAKGKDEVDKAAVITEAIENPIADEVRKCSERLEGLDTVKSVEEKLKDQIKAERAAKKATKQAKKKDDTVASSNKNMTVKDVVNTLKDIVIVAKEVQDVTAKVQAIHLETKKLEEANKTKAELKAERRAKQEAQRAAKQATQKQPEKPKETVKIADAVKDKEKSPKPKTLEKAKSKNQLSNRLNWFQHLNQEQDKQSLQKIPINSNLHPAIVRLGVQLASRVVVGSNARCIALLDAMKKMVRDYTLPARTELARGLEAHLAASLQYLWALRPPSASQTNAVRFFRHHLTQLPHNVDVAEAKETLNEEIDRYIREQIDMAGEAISIAVRNKIANGDRILTYGCSSLIERILVEAWRAGVVFWPVVAGCRGGGGGAGAGGGREMLRRLAAAGLPCTYLDITAVSSYMTKVSKVILGAGALLADGAVRAALGTAQVALLARAHNVPVLVAAETHKFSPQVQTDAFVYNEIGDPDELIDQSDPNSPLKDWRSNPNLTPLNLLYDITPPSLVTAVVTELAILPCTSAPVVLRFKQTEYGMQG